MRFTRLVLLAAACATVACDSSSTAPATQSIGSAGGTATSANSAASVVIPAGALAANVAEASLQMYTVTGGVWTVVAGSTVNASAHTVTGTTTHFSPYAPIGAVVIPVSTVTVTPATPTAIGAGVTFRAP